MNMIRQLAVLEAKRLGVYTCQEREPLENAAAQMVDRDVSSLVVVDEEGALQGIITRTDLMRACYEHGEQWRGRSVAQHMNRQVVTVQMHDTLERVIELLLTQHIHRVVAVERQEGKAIPLAVLSAADVVYHMVRRG